MHKLFVVLAQCIVHFMRHLHLPLPYIPLQDVALSFLHKHPTMELLSRLVIPRVSSHWYHVGLQLGVSPERLEVIEGEHRRKEDCCTALFTDWLRGATSTGSKQRSWESVLRAVETGHGTMAEGEIREGLKEAADQSDHQLADPDDKVKECISTYVRLYHAASAH